MKYLGLIGLLLLAAILGVGWKLSTQNPLLIVIAPAAEPSAEAAESAVVERDLLRTRQLTASLDSIAARAFEQHPNAALIAFSRIAPVNPSASTVVIAAAGGAIEHKRQVSLLYSGAGFNRAVVDGKYVRRGDRLPGGARVVNITRDSVVIRGADGRKVLHVPDARRFANSAN